MLEGPEHRSAGGGEIATRGHTLSPSQRARISKPLRSTGIDSKESIRQPMQPEPVFVKLLRSPGTDSQAGGPLRHPNLSYRPARLHKLAELGSLKVYKYGL